MYFSFDMVGMVLILFYTGFSQTGNHSGTNVVA
jgi:hypothetical protein